jgi:hypothetical protein
LFDFAQGGQPALQAIGRSASLAGLAETGIADRLPWNWQTHSPSCVLSQDPADSHELRVAGIRTLVPVRKAEVLAETLAHGANSLRSKRPV